ncbi:MAG: hypothetical protein P9F19_14050 [Candidatus Contendobacter sp.]|nr:hypothetical protein [Candidatus Contendobacter sp.]
MNSLILFVRGKNWQPDTWVTLAGGSKTESGQFVLENSSSWLSVYKYDEAFDDYDEAEENLVRELIQDPIPYLIEWRGDELLEKLISNIPADKDVIVDNDHGLICSVSKLKGLSVRDWVCERALSSS